VLSNIGDGGAMADIGGGFWAHWSGEYRPILLVFPP